MRFLRHAYACLRGLLGDTEPMERPLRILIHGMNYPPEMIGVGKYTGQLAAFLRGEGHAVEVVAAVPHYPGFRAQEGRAWTYTTVEEAGVRVTRCPLMLRRGGQGLWRLIAPLSFALAAAPVVAWRMLRWRPDVVLCVEPTLFAAPVALAMAWLLGSRVALHVQDLEIDAAFATAHLRGPALRRFALACERMLLRRFDAVVTISNAMAERLAEKGVERGRLDVVRNWVVEGPAAPTGAANAYRVALGVGAHERVLLYSGSLGAKQGLPTLLEALRRCADSLLFRVVIAGSGPMKSAVLAATGVLTNLIVLDLQPAEHLAELLAMADVHVLPQDGSAADLVFPSKIGPILGTGRPVVVTANPGTELALWLGAAAVVVPADDPAVLADALHEALADRVTVDRDRMAVLASMLDSQTQLPRFAAVLTSLAGRATVSDGPVPPTIPTWSVPEAADAMAPSSG